ncbi:unnamed protein product [Absidia cylindrospora]
MLLHRRFTPIVDWGKRFWTNNIHFLQLHYLYIFFLIFFFSALYYCEPGTNWNYIHALFMATTGSTNTGLNTVAISTISTYQTLVLFFSSFFGSHIGVSLIVVLIRRHYFSKRFEDVLLFNKARRMREEHRRKRRSSKGTTTARPSAPIHLRRIRRSSFVDNDDTPARQQKYACDTSILSNNDNDTHHSSTKSPPTSPNYSKIDMWSTDDDMGTCYPTDEEGDIGLRRVNTCPPSVENHHKRGINKTKKKTKKQLPDSIHPTATTSLNDADDDDDDDDDDSNTQTHDSIGNETTGIAFADNIEQQREMARQRLEQDRRFRDVLDKLTHNQEPQTSDDLLLDEDSHQEDELDRIMREPIDKSQLTREQRYRIGGAEYRALDILVKLVPAYYLGNVILFAFFFRIYIACSTYTQDVLRTTNPTGPIDPWFFSFFQALSAFNNLGIMLCDASMVPFQNAPAPLIFTMLLILFGNTAYAINLRFIIWSMYKLTPHSRPMRRETLRYMLDHPRRCYTTLFPATQTRWLLLTLVVITFVEWVSFLALNYWLPVLDGLNWGSRIIDGLFQSISTRNAGFAVISLMDLNPGTQLVYIVAMYISVYPVAISMRNSNVYQERALGIYRGVDDDEDGFDGNLPATGPSLLLKLKRHPTVTSVMTTGKKVLRRPDFFVVTQVQRQLSSDISWLLVALFIIIVAEAQRIMDPSPITVWTIIYESVSGFGNVGASQGYPDASVSQAGEYRTISKFVLILLMYKGRHRGLPASIDRAVMLPSDQLEEREVEENAFRRRNTVVSQTTNSGGSNSGPSFPNTFFHSKSSF